MIPKEELHAIAHQLQEKTRANQAEWKIARDDLAEEEVLQLGFPRSMVRLFLRSPNTEPDYAVLQLCNAKGERVAELRAEEGDSNWDFLRSLYEEAHRYATGWDEVLTDVQQAIRKPGKIGT
jgi:hypothetical protein